MPLTHAEQEEKARSYEAARQHYITKCAREERAQRRKQERRQNFWTDLRIAVYFIFFIFTAVWFFQHIDAVVAWWTENLHNLQVQIFGQ